MSKIHLNWIRIINAMQPYSACPSHFNFDEAVAVGDTKLTHVNGTTPAEPEEKPST